MREEFNPQEYQINPDDFNKFVSTLKGEEKNEIDMIITRYKNYEPAMAEAAIHVAVDRGMISYDLKERLLYQIRLNLSKKTKSVKQANWESNNAFTGYVAGYSDDDILNFIEDPADIVIDVYHAVLSEARKRDLISQEEFEKIYHDALNSGDEDEDILRDIIKYRYSGFSDKEDQNEYYADMGLDNKPLTSKQIEAQKEKYWKCPGCSELVDIDLAVCWNCQTPVPDKIEHPGTEDIKKELRTSKPFNPILTGFTLIIVAGLIVLRDSFRHSHHGEWLDGFTIFLVAIVLVPGIALVIYGILRKLTDK